MIRVQQLRLHVRFTKFIVNYLFSKLLKIQCVKLDRTTEIRVQLKLIRGLINYQSLQRYVDVTIHIQLFQGPYDLHQLNRDIKYFL